MSFLERISNKKYWRYHLLVILIVIVGITCCYANQKKGYYIDEGMTMVLSNGNYNGAVTTDASKGLLDFIEEFVWKGSISDTVTNVIGMLQELTGAGNYSQEGTVVWYDEARSMLQGELCPVSGEDLKNQIVAEPGKVFQYVQVYMNQAMDVHPPLYYFFVHTVFSIFSGTYSNWCLFGVNMVALILGCIVFYKLVYLLSQSHELSLLSVVFWGASTGFASTAVYFRMYAQLTFFVVIVLYMHLKFYKDQEADRKKIHGGILLSVIGGFCTQYYFILFLVPLFVGMCLLLLSEKRYVGCKSYLRTMVLSGIGSVILWPFSLYHIFFGYRGSEAMGLLGTGGFVTSIKGYWNVVGESFFFGNQMLQWIFVGIFLAGIVTCIVLHGKKVVQAYREYLCLMILPSLVYLCIVMKIAPVEADRYIMCLFPFIGYGLAVACYRIVGNISKIKLRQTVLIACVIAYGVITILFTTPNYLYPNTNDMVLPVEQPENTNCLFISPDDATAYEVLPSLTQYHQVLSIGFHELSLLDEYQSLAKENDLLIYIQGVEGEEREALLDEVEKRLGLEELQSEVLESNYEYWYLYGYTIKK